MGMGPPPTANLRVLTTGVGQRYTNRRERVCGLSATNRSDLAALQNCFSFAQGPVACRDDFLGFCYEVFFLCIVSRSSSPHVIAFVCRCHSGEFCRELACLKALSSMRKHAITLLKPFRRERDWSLSHRAPGIALPVMQSSLRLARERGEFL
jgi:hypothetical protein